MESKLKAAAQDSVGKLPAGYLHLPTTPIKQEPELTDWISGDLKPVRDGVYQRCYSHSAHPIYSKFYEGHWYCWNSTVEKASESKFISIVQHLKWRGIKK